MEYRVSRDAVRELMTVGTVWAIAVKILRLWTITLPNGELYIKMVMCDKEGDRIGATITPDLVPRFIENFVENEWRFIFGFRVVRAINVPRLSNHKCEIMFKGTTMVRYLLPISRNMFINSPKFLDVLNDKVDAFVLTDVIGQISSIGYLRRELPARDNEEPYTLAFSLTDENDDVISCVAYGSIAQRIHEEWIAEGKRDMVCLLRFWIFEKEIGAQNTKMICSSVRGWSDFFFNPWTEEAIKFRSNFMRKTDQGSVIDP